MRWFTVNPSVKIHPFQWKQMTNMKSTLNIVFSREISGLFPSLGMAFLCVIDTGCPSQFSCVSCRPSLLVIRLMLILPPVKQFHSEASVPATHHYTPLHVISTAAEPLSFSPMEVCMDWAHKDSMFNWRGHLSFHLIRGILTKSLIK
jgi:hypothetical protein